MPRAVPDWSTRKNIWLAFCKGNGDVIQRLSKNGRVYFSFFGPEGQKFSSWKKCEEFMKSSQPIPGDKVKVENSDHHLKVEVLERLSLSRNAVDEKLKYTKIVPTLQDGPEAADHLSAYSRRTDSISTHEQWMEVDEDCSSSKSETKLGSDRQKSIYSNSSEDHEGARYILKSRKPGKTSDVDETKTTHSYVQSNHHISKSTNHRSYDDDERDGFSALRNEQTGDRKDVSSEINRDTQHADTMFEDASYHQYKRHEHCTKGETQGKRTNKFRFQTLNDEHRLRYYETKKSGGSKRKFSSFLVNESLLRRKLFRSPRPYVMQQRQIRAH